MTDIEIPTVPKFIEMVKDIDNICKTYEVSYEIIKRTAELLDDFGWDSHPAMILALNSLPKGETG